MVAMYQAYGKLSTSTVIGPLPCAEAPGRPSACGGDGGGAVCALGVVTRACVDGNGAVGIVGSSFCSGRGSAGAVDRAGSPRSGSDIASRDGVRAGKSREGKSRPRSGRS